MRDLMNNVAPKRAISPAAATTDNTPFVSQIVDTQGFESLTFLILTGQLADADATFTTTVEHGDDAALSDVTTAGADDLIGTGALASFVFSDDDKVFKIAYRGPKRYARLRVVPANNTGNAFVASVALLGHPAVKPTSNPPA